MKKIGFIELVKKLVILYFIGFVIAMGLTIFNQSIYLISKKALLTNPSKLDENGRKVMERRMIFFYDLMASYGMNTRAISAASILITGFAFYIPVLWLIGELFFLNKMNLDQNSFLIFVTKPDQCKLLVKGKIMDILNRIKESHLNYDRNVIMKQTKQAFKHHHESSKRSNYASAGLLQPLYSPSSTNKISNRTELEKRSQHYLKHKPHKQSHDHILELIEDCSSVWPKNRTERWFQIQHFLIIIIFYGVMILSFLFGQSVVFYSLHLSYEAMKRKSERFSFADRIAAIQEPIVVYLVLEVYGYSICVTLAQVIDQFYYIFWLKKEFANFFQKITKARLVEHANDEARYLLGSSHRKEWSLDSEAIDLYVSFSLFIKETEPALRLCSLRLSQFGAFACLLLFSVSNFVTILDPSEMRLVVGIALVEIYFMNGLFCLCAAFNAECMRLIKRVWAIIAQTSDCKERTSLSQDEQSEKKQLHDDTCYLFTGELVTPHTLLLWRRLNKDTEQVVHQFAIYLFGAISVNFSNIVRFNFWLFSVLGFIIKASQE